MRRTSMVLMAALALVLAACGGSGSEETTTTAGEDTTTTEAAAAEGTTITTAESDFGTILVDDEGFTLYMFVPDEGGEATCVGGCADLWPPLTGEAVAGEGVDESLLGTVEHPEQGTMATYNGWPLYYYTPDANPGDVNGQGVNDVWFVLDPSGEPIMDTGAAGEEEAADGGEEEAASGPALTVAQTDLGSILTDSEGRSLYLFTPDAQGDPTCYDQCAGNWPPLTGESSAGEGVDASLIGTVERTDGTAQVTYNGWPLYYFAGDAAAGDTEGQGLNDVWFVVDPSGNAVEGTAATSSDMGYDY